MLDTDVDRIRTDRLREFLEERKREAEADHREALDRDQSRAVSESTGAVEAYEAVLAYVDAKSTGRGPSLDQIRNTGPE